MIFIVLFIFISIISSTGILFYYYSIFKNNKSKIAFDLDKNLELNSEKEYVELCDMHNKLYYATKKKKPLGYLILFTTLSGFLSFFIIIALYPTINFLVYIPFFILLPITAILVCIFSNSKNANKNYDKTYNTYYDVILKNIIRNKFTGINSKNAESINKDITELDLEDIENALDYIEIKTKLVNTIFNNTNRKFYPSVSVDFDIKYYSNGHDINIMRFSNHSSSSSHDSLYYFSFIGYIVSISNFTNLNLLNNIRKNDFYYDDSTQILYLIISDITNKFFSDTSKDFFKPDLSKKFEKNKFLEKKIIFFDELHNFINKLLV